MHVKRESIIGSNTIIPPTPAIIPSRINDWNHGLKLEIEFATKGVK